MGKGISIGIASETKEFMTGIKTGVIAPLDNAADSIKDLAKQGDKLDDIESGMKGAQKATAQFDKEIQASIDSMRQVSATSKKSSREVSDDFRSSADAQKQHSSETMKEIGNEAKANAAETFSSFDGSAMSFVDGIQGTFGGLMSSLGPLGLVAGAAGALGIGLINSALSTGAETTQGFKDRVSDLTTELIESGEIGTISLDHILDKLKALASKEDEQKNSLKSLAKLAKESGTKYDDLATAYAGSGDELDKVSESGKKHLKILTEQRDAMLNSAEGWHLDTVLLQQKMDAQTEVNAVLGETKKVIDEAAEATALYAEAGGPAMQLKVDLIKQIDGAYDDAAGSVDDYIDKESGIFDLSKYIAAMDAKKKALQEYQETLSTSGLSPAAKTFLEAQGADAAATLLAGYKTGTAEQKNALARIWDEAGGTSSGAYTAAVQKGLNNSAITMPVYKVPAPDTTAFEKAMKDLLNTKRDLIITAHSRSGVQIL